MTNEYIKEKKKVKTTAFECLVCPVDHLERKSRKKTPMLDGKSTSKKHPSQVRLHNEEGYPRSRRTWII